MHGPNLPRHRDASRTDRPRTARSARRRPGLGSARTSTPSRRGSRPRRRPCSPRALGAGRRRTPGPPSRCRSRSRPSIRGRLPGTRPGGRTSGPGTPGPRARPRTRTIGIDRRVACARAPPRRHPNRRRDPRAGRHRHRGTAPDRTSRAPPTWRTRGTRRWPAAMGRPTKKARPGRPRRSVPRRSSPGPSPRTPLRRSIWSASVRTYERAPWRVRSSCDLRSGPVRSGDGASRGPDEAWGAAAHPYTAGR